MMSVILASALIRIECLVHQLRYYVHGGAAMYLEVKEASLLSGLSPALAKYVLGEKPTVVYSILA